MSAAAKIAVFIVLLLVSALGTRRRQHVATERAAVDPV
jgi:hypothetical protein